MAERILDLAHVAFLDIIRALIAQVGATSTKGTLVRLAVKAGEKVEVTDFPTLDDFVTAIDDARNPTTWIEGKAVHIGDGLFGLPKCPFAESIANFKTVFGGLPESYGEVTAEFNKPSHASDGLHVGNGSGVSPFCSVHQPMRESVGQRITIGGKPITIYQLGCKSAAGKKALAERWIAEAGFSAEAVDKVLDNNMCCYGVKVVA